MHQPYGGAGQQDDALRIADPVNVNRFGAEMGRLMQASGIGVNELARQSGYTTSYISQLRSGKRSPSAHAAQDLDQVLQAGGKLAALAASARAAARKTAPAASPCGPDASDPGKPLVADWLTVTA